MVGEIIDINEIMNKSMKDNRLELREKLSKLEHEQWNHWAVQVHNEVSQERQDRWSKLIPLKYEELSEEQKDNDRFWADKIIDMLRRRRVVIVIRASDRYNPAYLKEMMGLMCQKCEIMVTKCSSCGERFGFADRIYCATPEHICQNCWERKKKVIAVN